MGEGKSNGEGMGRVKRIKKVKRRKEMEATKANTYEREKNMPSSIVFQSKQEARPMATNAFAQKEMTPQKIQFRSATPQIRPPREKAISDRGTGEREKKRC